MHPLQEPSKKAEALVTHFENNNSEYIKIKRTIEELKFVKVSLVH